MQRCATIRVITLGLTLAFGASLCRAEQVDNPQYKQWSKFKAGAWVKHKSETSFGDQKTSQEMTTKLVELTPEKAVIESTISMTMGDQKMDMPAQKMDVPAKVEKKTEPTAAEKPATKEGDETITVAGKSLKCHWTETTIKQEGGTIVSKVWMCDDIPGSMAKMESNSQMGEMKSTTTMSVAEFSAGG
jgi:hypothetical protein